MAATNFNQSGGELRIQDGGAHESRPCWKTAHQPQRRTGIGLTDFRGDTNHAMVSQKCHATSKSTWLTLINWNLFWGGKLPTGLEGLRSLSQTRPICQLRINLYTCHSNIIQLYFSKILIFYRQDLCGSLWPAPMKIFIKNVLVQDCFKNYKS